MRHGLVAAVIIPAIISAVLILIPVASLILCAADYISAECAEARSDCCTFESASALIPDDTTRRRSAECADCSARARIWAAGAGSECERCERCE